MFTNFPKGGRPFNNKHRLTIGSLFDGIGGFPYAGSFFGIEALWASEIQPQAISVTRRHFPNMAHMGDIRELHGGKLPPVDIITFGSPCQDNAEEIVIPKKRERGCRSINTPHFLRLLPRKLRDNKAPAESSEGLSEYN